jgi:hypothetical protein
MFISDFGVHRMILPLAVDFQIGFHQTFATRPGLLGDPDAGSIARKMSLAARVQTASR